ncbi:unnamed protein product, partial [Prorocentrum cordatum]
SREDLDLPCGQPAAQKSQRRPCKRRAPRSRHVLQVAEDVQLQPSEASRSSASTIRCLGEYRDQTPQGHDMQAVLRL